jgi:hypothetical protein
MGYLTRFHLQTFAENEKVATEAYDYLDYGPDGDYECSMFGGYNGQTDPMKWYGWKEDLIVASKKFPTVTFIMSGNGEDDGDLWRAYALDGEIEMCDGQVIFNPPKSIPMPEGVKG